MRRFRVALLLLLAALILGALGPVRGRSGFTIEGADSMRRLDVRSSSSAERTGPIDQLDPRIVLEFVDASLPYALALVPGALGARLKVSQPRFLIEFASANRFYSFSDVPAQLGTLLERLSPRFVLVYADANRGLTLDYPDELFDGGDVLQVGNVQTTPAGMDSTTISWRTEMPADSVARCGTEPGEYMITVSVALRVRDHRTTVTGLTDGTTYYCRVSGSTANGKAYRSRQFTFEQVAEYHLYLPLVRRS